MSTEAQINGDLPRAHPYAIPAAEGKPSTNAYGRQRAEKIKEFLNENPSDAQTLVRLGWFPNNEKASTCLRNLYKRKQILFREFAQMSNGQFRLVYATRRVSNVLHEYEITQLVTRSDATSMRRGQDVDQRFRADAELEINGQIFYVEMDRGSEGRPQVRKQMDRYKSAHADVLWICQTEKRMRSLMSLTDSPTTWFTTYEQSLTPHEEVWTNIHGEVTALPMAQGMAQ